MDVSQAEENDGDPFIGSTLAGKYHLTELIGVGAMGRVYRADHLALDAQVAVKLLNPDIAADAPTAKRFQTEARASSRLRHPNTIQILDFGQAESGTLYIVMELLRGRTLSRIIEEGAALGIRRIVELLGQALSALDEAHAAGVVHRDFKPENIFVEMLRTGREQVKVLDFGIAKLRGEADAGLTSRGAVCGTPEYMSPEQIRGEELDARSDVYAAGVVLYEMLALSRPFESRGAAIEVLTAHLQQTPDPPSKRRPDAQIPPAVEQVCLRAMAKAKEQRYRSAAELKHALEIASRGLSGEHCAQCGTPLPGTARFCHECGAVLRPTTSFVAAQKNVTGPAGAPDAAGAPSAKRALPPLPLPLVGRADVLDRLDGLDREALLLVGDAGIGKSAVALAWAAREEGRFRKVIVVDADPTGSARPLYPVRRAIGALLGIGDRPSAGVIAQALAGHLEDRAGLDELFGLGGVASALPLDVRRRECTAAVLNTARRSAVSFLFEDVHLYDMPSKRLLAQLVSMQGEATVLATAQHPEALAVEVEVVRLGPLGSDALEELVRLGLPPGMGELTGGVPFALVAWLRSRLEGAKDSSVESRLGRLPEASRAVAEIVAVAGGDVPTPLLAQIVGVPEPGRAIAELALRGWLKAGDASRSSLELASPTLRKLVYDGVPAARRQGFHVALAKQLHERGEDPILVAFHAHEAGGAPSVMLERAGDAARDGFDDDTSARLYRAALDRGRHQLAQGRGDEGRQIRIALKLGLVQRYRGEVLQSEQVLREALELSKGRGDRWAEVQARRGLARLASNWDNLDSAKEHLVSACGAALGGGDPGMLADLYLDLADVLGRLGDHAGAQRELWEGLMICTGGDGPEGDRGPDALWRMLLQLGELVRKAGKLDSARGYGLQTLKHADRAKSGIGRARAHAFLGAVHQSLGRTQHAAEHRRLAADEMRRVGDRRSTAELLLALALPNAEAGLPKTADAAAVSKLDARAWLKEADALAGQVGWQEGVQRSRAALAALG